MQGEITEQKAAANRVYGGTGLSSAIPERGIRLMSICRAATTPSSKASRTFTGNQPRLMPVRDISSAGGCAARRSLPRLISLPDTGGVIARCRPIRTDRMTRRPRVPHLRPHEAASGQRHGDYSSLEAAMNLLIRKAGSATVAI